MSDEILSLLSKLPGADKTLGEDQILFHRGDAVRQLYIVIDGDIRLVRHLEDGTALILQRAQAGAIVAEASLFSTVYHCDAVAFAPTRLRAVAKRGVLERMRQAPAFAEALASHLARGAQRARLGSEILRLKTVAQRLDAWLAWHDGVLPDKGAWRAIALEIGVSPEALYRELSIRRRSTRRA